MLAEAWVHAYVSRQHILWGHTGPNVALMEDA